MTDTTEKKQKPRLTFKGILYLSFKLSVAVSLVLFILVAILHIPFVQKKTGDILLDWAASKIDKSIECESYHLSLLGTLEINNLVLHHNPRFGSEPLCSIGYVYAVFDPLSILSDKIRIRDVHIQDPFLNIIFTPERTSNLFKDDYVWTNRQNTDDSQIRKAFKMIQLDHVTITRGILELDYKPLDYLLKIPEYYLEGNYDPEHDVIQTTIKAYLAHNTIPGKLDIKANIKVKADLWGGGISKGFATLSSIETDTDLSTEFILENLRKPKLKLEGSASLDLNALPQMFNTDTTLSGTAGIFFQGSGPAENLNITGKLVAKKIQFNKFRFADFSGSVNYFNKVFTVPDGHGSAYDGKYSGTASIGISQDSKYLNISTVLKNADLALVTNDLNIPFQFNSNTDISLKIQSESFKFEDLRINGFASGTEKPEDDQPDNPLHLACEFGVKNGLFGISRATLENSIHKAILSNCIFDKTKLAGSISGNSSELENLLQKIHKFYTVPFYSPELSGNIAYSLNLNGTLENYDVDADINTSSTKLKSQDLGSVQLTASVNPEFVNISSISISGDNLQAMGNLKLLTPGQPEYDNQPPLEEISIEVKQFNLGILDHIFERSIPLTGITSGNIFMNISDENQKTIFHGKKASYAGVPVKDLVLKGILTDYGFENFVFSASPGSGELSVEGSVYFDRANNLKISGHNIPFDLIPVFNELHPEGNFDINAYSIQNDDENSLIDYKILSNRLNLGNIETGAIEVSGQLNSLETPIVSWTANWNKQMFSSTGWCLLDDELTCSMENQFTDFPLTIPFGVLREVTLTDLPVAGLITADSSVSGELRKYADITAEFDISALNIESLGTRFDLANPTNLKVNNRKIQIAETSLVSSEKTLNLKGLMTIDGKLDLTLNGTLGLSPLENLTSFLDSTSGNISLDLNLGGSLSDPDLSGTAFIQEFYAYIPSFDLWLDDYHSEILLNQKIGKIIYLEGIAGGSYMGGEGEIGFSQYFPKLFDVKLKGDDIDFEYPEGFESQGNIDLEILGTLPDINFAGNIELEHCIYSDRINFKTMIINESRAKLNLTQKSKQIEEKLDSKLLNPTFGINVNAQDGFFVDNNMARAEMSMKLNILGSLNKPQVLGHIDILRGDVTFMDRSFEIMNASVDFADPTSIDPLVTFRAESDIDNYRVTLNVNGRFYSDLNIQPSATPPLNDLDLWNLLLIGKTRDSMTLSSDDYLASGVAYVTGSLQEQIEQQFEYWMGFDEFSIDPIMSTSDESPSAKFTVKKRFGSDLSVLYSRSASSTGDLLMIEYQLSNNLFVIGQKTEDNSIEANIKYRWEFE